MSTDSPEDEAVSVIYTSDMAVRQDEAEILKENANVNAERKKKKRRRRNRSEKQKERTRKYKRKKRQEKIQLELEKLSNEGNFGVSSAAIYLTDAEAWANENVLSESGVWYLEMVVDPTAYRIMYWPDFGSRYPTNLPFAADSMVPVAEVWCPEIMSTGITGFYLPNAQIWQQAEFPTLNIQEDPLVPLYNTTISSEIVLPTVDTPYELYSTSGASGEIFAPGEAVEPQLFSVGAVESQLFSVGAVESQLFSVGAYASTQSASCFESDIIARLGEDLFELTAAEPLKAPTFTTGSSFSNVSLEEASAYIVDHVDSDVLSGSRDRASTSISLPDLQHDYTMVSQIIPYKSVDDVENIFGILAIYTESALHCEFDKAVTNNKETVEVDGYTYLTLSNLLN